MGKRKELGESRLGPGIMYTKVVVDPEQYSNKIVIIKDKFKFVREAKEGAVTPVHITRKEAPFKYSFVGQDDRGKYVKYVHEGEDVRRYLEREGIEIHEGHDVEIVKKEPQSECIIVTYSYPQYITIARNVRDHYLSTKRIYEPFKRGYKTLSSSLLKYSENQPLLKIVTKNLLANIIVKTCKNIGSMSMFKYVLPFTLFFLTCLLLSLRPQRQRSFSCRSSFPSECYSNDINY